MTKEKVENLYKELTTKEIKYSKEKHCKMLLTTMTNTLEGKPSDFILKAKITKKIFNDWLREHKEFRVCYDYGVNFQQKSFEDRLLSCDSEKDQKRLINAFNTIFGFGRQNKVFVRMNADTTPMEQYKDLIRQASTGEFTTAEIKQLMESLNVGNRVYELFKMQEDVDELREALQMMEARSASNIVSIEGVAEKN